VIETLSATPESVAALADLLIEATAHGASVSFMHPLAQDKAEAYWRKALGDGRVVLGARDGARLVGTVSLVLDLPENQPHRAEIQKVLVAASHRRRGIARALMLAAEREAAKRGRWLLVLDAVTGDPGARLYESLAWNRVGEIPDFALYPDGRLCPTTFYWKRV
jgi:ribosomal protein S18 acetylase RimI-like enzyme